MPHRSLHRVHAVHGVRVDRHHHRHTEHPLFDDVHGRAQVGAPSVHHLAAQIAVRATAGPLRRARAPLRRAQERQRGQGVHVGDGSVDDAQQRRVQAAEEDGRA